METLYIIISIGATLVTTLVPSIIKITTLAKSKINAQAEAAKEKAQNAINSQARNLVAGAEVGLAAIDDLLKKNNCGTAGAMKKHDAIRDLKVFCLEHGYGWNDEEMNAVIEKEIEFSKVVNAK